MPVLVVQIQGIAGPGATCTGPDSVFLGVQRLKDVEQVVPSSAPEPTFRLEAEWVSGEGGMDVRGPYVHGPKGDRFFYLAWLDGPAGSMVARIKLRVADIPDDVRVAALASGGLEATLALVNARGEPRSGSVRPPDVTWRALKADEK